MKRLKTVGFYPSFDRSGEPTLDTHYCPGCGHGILHKLITEALVERGIQDRTIIVNPIGCAVFGYYYWDAGNIGAAHGRAQAVATALTRLLPHAIVLCYQGDGDLGAIGFNCTLQAAARGERFATFFVNNASYGMTGGQMAPTTLLGQVTSTTPHGRSAENDGYPLHICEILNQLQAPVYIERCSLADTPRIMKARRAIHKALDLQIEDKGYAFVEFLSPCPTNWATDAVGANQFILETLEKEFPLGCLRDRSSDAHPRPLPPSRPSLNEYFGTSEASDNILSDPNAPEVRFKFAGFGGQGILSLGMVAAEAGRLAGRNTTWFPFYGPEQRGGAAACSVVISGRPIGSPVVDHPDILVCMNRYSYDRFADSVAPGGLILCDTLETINVPPPHQVRRVDVPATELAGQSGAVKAANTVMLAALAWLRVAGLSSAGFLTALESSFKRKPALIPLNRRIFETALEWCKTHLAPPISSPA